jgi:hypothetical protein
MDVDDRHARDLHEEAGREDVVETSEHDEPRSRTHEGIGHRTLSDGPRPIRVDRERTARHARALRTDERGNPVAIGRDEDDARGKTAVGARVEDRLKVRAAARDEDADR